MSQTVWVVSMRLSRKQKVGGRTGWRDRVEQVSLMLAFGFLRWQL